MAGKPRVPPKNFTMIRQYVVATKVSINGKDVSADSLAISAPGSLNRGRAGWRIVAGGKR